MMNLRTEKKIMENWQGELTRPLVSVLCTTYNHESYIEDALNGFLIQETDFSFEILIHDDASTDNTANIIKKYEVKYPNIIKPIYQTENQFSKGIKPFHTILLPKSAGEYIAFCEGDDYWTDPEKLQIQCDFLQNNADFGSSFHDFVEFDENKQTNQLTLPISLKRDFSGEEIIKFKSGAYLRTVMYRNCIKEYPDEMKFILQTDIFLTSILGFLGSRKFHDNIKPAVYRYHGDGVWSGLDTPKQKETYINTYFWIYKYYNRIGQKKYASYFFDKFLEVLFDYLTISQLSRNLFKKFSPLKIIKPPIKFVFKKIGLLDFLKNTRDKIVTHSRRLLKRSEKFDDKE